LALAVGSVAAASGTPRVLQVGSDKGIQGKYSSIQAAVNDAQPGDWILIGPGDYREPGSTWLGAQVAVWIATPGIHLRGMDRNHVIVDGTASGPTCSAAAGDQNQPPNGNNGIEIYKVDAVSDSGGVIGMNSYHGAYLTATSTYFDPTVVAPPNVALNVQYGIFSSNARGPGLIEHSYASNMADSSFFISAPALTATRS
jgi:hypothetical protein